MIYRSIAGLLFIARMHVSPAASAVKLRKATLVYEILEFSWFFFICISLSFYKSLQYQLPLQSMRF